MADFIQTNELTGTTAPSNAGTLIRDAQWGIDTALSNWIIQSETSAVSRVTDQTQDQKGAVVSELDYDEQTEVSFDIIGSGTLPVVGDIGFTYDGKTWKVESVNYQGSYNDKKKYSVTIRRWKNFPATSQGNG